MAFVWYELLGVQSKYGPIQILDMVLGINFKLCTHCHLMILIGSVRKIGSLEQACRKQALAPTQFLAKQLTLSQPRGQIMPTTVLQWTLVIVNA